jgi:hypothetical protein
VRVKSCWVIGIGFRKKIRPFRGRERPVLAKSSGEEGKLVL